MSNIISQSTISQFDLAQPKPQSQEQVVSFTNVNTPATSEEVEAMRQSKVPRILESIGLGDVASKLPMNQMGRITLMNALASKFGPDFYKQAEAQQVMSAFDQYLQDYKIEAGRSLNDVASKGKRTLEYLLG